MNGPSVSTMSPSWWRRTVAELEAWSPPLKTHTSAGNATDIQTTSDPLFLVNMSLWSDAEALFEFVYRSAHAPEMARRREYFERFEGAYQALWWVPAGHVPDVDEGLSRLWRLDRYGPTREAFTFKMRFPAPGLPGSPKDMEPEEPASARSCSDTAKRKGLADQ
jgi:hypothetical protein